MNPFPAVMSCQVKGFPFVSRKIKLWKRISGDKALLGLRIGEEDLRS